METCRLSTSHVKLGVPLPGNVYNEHGNLLLSKGQVLDSQTQLDTLLERGMYVEVGVFDACFRTPSAPPTAEEIEQKFDPFLVRNSLKISLNRLLRNLVDGNSGPAQVMEFAGQLRAFIQSDLQAAIASSLLDRDEPSHPVAHSMNTAILSTILAEHMEWPSERQQSLACAALTMNIRMLDLQQRALRQETPLSPPQKSQLVAHPDAAVEQLRAQGVTDARWLRAVGEHHEKPGGKGYPHQLPAPSEESQIVRIADVFFGRTSSRGDRPALAPSLVIRNIYAEEGQGTGATLVGALLKLLGLYPPGSFVKLANQEIAVVFRNGNTAKTPLVAAVTTSSGMPTMQPVRRDTEREIFAITEAVNPEKVSLGYDLGKLWISHSRH